MKKSSKLFGFVKGVAMLSATAVIMRAVAVYFNLYLTERIGAEGIGLFTLTATVYGFAVTFATSAVNLGATRLVSESLGRRNDRALRASMKKCIAYSLSFGCAAFIILSVLAYPIGAFLLGDIRTIPSLRLFAVSLPFISLTSAMNGYFTAVRRVGKSASVQICEQAVRICTAILLLGLIIPENLKLACMCVVLAGTAADVLSFIYSLIMYLYDLKKHVSHSSRREIERERESKGGLLSITLPVALSSYLRSGLVTLEHMLIPWGLRKKGGTNGKALETYGIMQAMALPVVMFPYAFLSPFCALIIPEISERRAAGDTLGIKKVASSAFGFVLAFGIGISGIMGCFANELGTVICKSGEAAGYITLLAPLVPVMYLDTVTDSILKGLNKQLYTMRINILDAFLSVIIVFLLVPRIGVYGYIAEIFVCELINASLSVKKLLSVVSFKVDLIKHGLFPLISITLATAASRALFTLLDPRLYRIFGTGAVVLTLHITVTALLYLLLLRLSDRLIFSGLSGKKAHASDTIKLTV